jgi:hypothetical protein
MPGLDIKYLARRGAIARLAELQAEQAALLKAFPDLRGAGRAGVAYTDDGTTVLPGRRGPRRRRGGMSAGQRKAVSVRMKAYWAQRRKSAKRQ